MAKTKINQRQYGSQYSTSEEPTGDTWLDGKQIWKRTVTGTITSSASTRSFLTVTYSSASTTQIIKVEGMYLQGTGQYIMIGSVYSGTGGQMYKASTVMDSLNGTATFISYDSDARSNAPYNITFYYTKS